MLSAKKYVYYLPGENNSAKEFEASVNSLVIIGANGSGKSKLGAWMERQNGEDVHRIGAQRSLNFSEHVPLKSYEEAEGEFFYGSPYSDHWGPDKGVRWDWGKSDTTKLIDDYDAALSALLAQQNIDRHHFLMLVANLRRRGGRNRIRLRLFSTNFMLFGMRSFPIEALSKKTQSFLLCFSREMKTAVSGHSNERWRALCSLSCRTSALRS